MFLIMHVDDILLVRNHLEMIAAIKKWLSSIFEIKDIGKAMYVLGVKIVKTHPKDILGMVLKHFQVHNSQPVDTLVES